MRRSVDDEPEFEEGFDSLKQAIRAARRNAKLLEFVRKLEASKLGPKARTALNTYRDPRWVVGEPPAKSDRARALRIEYRALAEVYAGLCRANEEACKPPAELAASWIQGRETELLHQAADFFASCLLLEDLQKRGALKADNYFALDVWELFVERDDA